MKTKLLLALTFLFLFSAPKSFSLGNPEPNRSQQFGNDVIVHYDPDKNDGTSALGVAFNGWIYSAYTSSLTNLPGTEINLSVSKDSGQTWQFLTGVLIGSHNGSQVFDIVVTGNDTSSLRVYVSGWNYSIAFPWPYGFVRVYDGQSGTLLPYGLQIGDGSYEVKEVHLSTDVTHPSAFSNGFSVGILYNTGQGDFTSTDSLICMIATDSGSFNYNYYVLDTNSVGAITKPTIGYGYSQAWNNGRYFVSYLKNGHIAYCRNSSSIVAGFSTPIFLDSIAGISPGTIEAPKIVCQNSTINNDSTGLSVMVVGLSTNLTGHKIPVILHNHQAAYSDYWNVNEVLNPLVSTNFSTTYFDATFSELENRFYLSGYNSDSGNIYMALDDYNFSHPANWYIVNSHYNDTILDPNQSYSPRIVSYGEFAYSTWACPATGNGIDPSSKIMFDKESLPIVTSASNILVSKDYLIYPNPSSEYFYLENTIKNHTLSEVNLFDISGKLILNKIISNGESKTKINVHEIPNGIYQLQLISTTGEPFGFKLVISR